MNAFFVTQSGSLDLLHGLMERLAGPLELDRTGFFVTDSLFFRRFASGRTGLAESKDVLKEWELMAEALARREPLAKDRILLESLDERSGRPSVVWEALFCDRRLMLGNLCRWRPDYVPRFNHEELIRIAARLVGATEDAFDRIQPDALFSLVPVSFGEYLIWAVAKARGIPSFYLTPTKIENRMFWADHFFGQATTVVDRFHTLQQGAVFSDSVGEAQAYLATATRDGPQYEGMIPVPGTIRTQRKARRRPLLKRLKGLLRAELEYRCTAQGDNHIPGFLLPAWHSRVIIPLRARAHAVKLRREYLSARDLPNANYVFFPLNSEPEISLSIQSKPYVNQIEAVRSVARSLPIGMELFVKEHPRSIGYRSLAYYRKLLRIPNVRLVDPSVESPKVIEHSQMVISVWSFVGFEALLSKIPVIVLGTPSFTMLPNSMVRAISDINTLPRHVSELLKGYQFDQEALENYVAACIDCSVPIDFYSLFLGKKDRLMGSDVVRSEAHSEEWARQMGLLVDYTVSSVNEQLRCGLESNSRIIGDSN